MVARPVDADVVDPRLHPEGVQQPVVVVREAVALVDGDVELVGALDEIEALDRERRLGRRRSAAAASSPRDRCWCRSSRRRRR